MPPTPSINSKKNAIFIGLGAGHIDITPANAQAAFVQAMDDLPDEGGVLYVMPGTAPYVFQSAVVIDKPNTRIEFCSGPADASGMPDSYLAFPASGGPKQLFRVDAPRFHCRGAYVRHEAFNVSGEDDDRSCILVQGANDARLEACTFELKQSHAEIVNFSAIRGEGISEASPLHGLRILDCTFIIREEGTAQSMPFDPAGPMGVICVRARNAVETMVRGGQFRGAEGVPMVRDICCGSAIVLDNCPASIIADSVFRLLDLVTDVMLHPAASLIRVLTHASEAGHRTVLARLLFEEIRTKTAIELSDARSDVVAYCNVGRLSGSSESAVEVNGNSSRDVVIGGVGFHNVSASVLPVPPGPFSFAIDLRGVRNSTISSLVFSPFSSDQRFLRIAPRTCSNVLVDSTLARRAPQ